MRRIRNFAWEEARAVRIRTDPEPDGNAPRRRVRRCELNLAIDGALYHGTVVERVAEQNRMGRRRDRGREEVREIVRAPYLSPSSGSA